MVKHPTSHIEAQVDKLAKSLGIKKAEKDKSLNPAPQSGTDLDLQELDEGLRAAGLTNIYYLGFDKEDEE
jgi:hypothetical protein